MDWHAFNVWLLSWNLHALIFECEFDNEKVVYELLWANKQINDNSLIISNESKNEWKFSWILEFFNQKAFADQNETGHCVLAHWPDLLLKNILQFIFAE